MSPCPVFPCSGYDVTVHLINLNPSINPSQLQPVGGSSLAPPSGSPAPPTLFGGGSILFNASSPTISPSQKMIIVLRLMLTGANITPFTPEKQKALLGGLAEVRWGISWGPACVGGFWVEGEDRTNIWFSFRYEGCVWDRQSLEWTLQKHKDFLKAVVF